MHQKRTKHINNKKEQTFFLQKCTKVSALVYMQTGRFSFGALTILTETIFFHLHHCLSSYDPLRALDSFQYLVLVLIPLKLQTFGRMLQASIYLLRCQTLL